MRPPRPPRSLQADARPRRRPTSAASTPATALIALLIGSLAGCAAQRTPGQDRRPVVDHPQAPLPPGLNPDEVQLHHSPAMARALMPFEAIVAQLPPPQFLAAAVTGDKAPGPDDDRPPQNDAATPARPAPPPLKVQLAYVAAQQSLREGRIFEATRHLAEADRLMPGQPEIIRLLGHIYLGTGNHSRGRDYLIRAVKFDPTDWLSMYELGRLAHRNQEEDEAIATLAHLVQSLNDEDDAPPAYLPLAHHQLALAMQRRGYDLAALEQFHLYMVRSPLVRPHHGPIALQLRLLERTKDDTLMQMGDLYARLGKPGEALHAYRQAQQAGAGQLQALLRRLVYINLRLDRPDDAAAIVTDHLRALQAEDLTARDHEMLAFLARVHPPSAAPLADALRQMYDAEDRPTNLALAVADLLDDANADAFLRAHLAAHPHDDRVFKRLLRLKLGDDPAAFDNARLADAVQVTTQALNRDDELLELFIANLFDAVGDPKKLADSFETFPPALKQDRYARLILGECLFLLERADEGMALLKNLVRDEPELVKPRQLLAALLLSQNQPNEALETIAPIATPDHPVAMQLQAAALMRLDRAPEAQDKIEQALRQRPTEPDLLIALAQVQTGRNDLVGAERTLLGGIASNTQEEKFYLALLELYLGPMRDRTDIGQKYRNLAMMMYSNMPRNRHARVMRARILEAERDYEGAVRLLRAVLQQQPDDLLTMRQLGQLYKRMGRPDEARRLITDRLEDLPDDPDRHYELAGVASLIDEPALAESIMVDLLKRHPNHASTNNDLGYTWIDKGIHLERAVKMIEMALAAEPDNAHYLDSLGWGHYKLGRFDEAIAQLDKAARIDADPIVLDHLGDAQYRAGQHETAVATWTRALQNLITERLSAEPYDDLLDTLRGKIEAARLEREPRTAPLGENVEINADRAGPAGTAR